MQGLAPDQSLTGEFDLLEVDAESLLIVRSSSISAPFAYGRRRADGASPGSGSGTSPLKVLDELVDPRSQLADLGQEFGFGIAGGSRAARARGTRS